MIPVFVCMFLVPFMMARRRKRRSNGRFVAIPFEVSITLSTLGDNTVLSSTILSNNFARDIYLISVKAYWSMSGNTSLENPIAVGFSHSDLSVTEISEALIAEVSDPSDIIAAERARRPVRRTGQFAGPDVNQMLADGRLVRTGLKFAVTDGKQLSVYAVNRSNAALTTGTVIHCSGTIFGRWQ